MRIATAHTVSRNADAMPGLYHEIVARLGGTPDLLILHCGASYPAEPALKALSARAPGVPVHGGTSCLRVMTEAGCPTPDGGGMALLGIRDPGGSYGVGAAEIGEAPESAAALAIQRALDHAGCPGEAPELVWMTAAPGCEEALISGISGVVGDHVPIAGGSAADDGTFGEWRQFAHGRVFTRAVVVTALFPSTEVMFAFHSGYEPTDKKGTVTRTGPRQAAPGRPGASGRRLFSIDHEPAARVYDRWSEGLISDLPEKGGNILSRTSLNPLGRVAGRIGGIPVFQLAHPETVTPDKGLTLFADVSEGDEVVLMRGTADSLVSRAGRVAESILETWSVPPSEVAGALVIYCAGCMLAVKDRLDEVVSGLTSALPGVPFLGTFTFGEQGCFAGGENRHGNLMISVLMFKKQES